MIVTEVERHLAEGRMKECFNATVIEFMDHPWQEDVEIEFVALVDEYRERILGSSSKMTRNYLRSLSENNSVWSDQRFTDTFLTNLDELIRGH